jgi:hypothetical protein
VLAIVFSALFTFYLLVPEAIFRHVFGFFISSRSFVLTRVEKAQRAVLITIIPFLLALALTWYLPGPQTWPFGIKNNTVQQRRADYETVWAAFYSDAEFVKSGTEFWHAASRCSRRQARLGFWYIVLIFAEAGVWGAVASNYPTLVKSESLKWIPDTFLTPYISQWHPLLSMPSGTVVQADVLCVDTTLYQGEISEFFLKDGELSGLILTNPRRFDRRAYLKAKDSFESDRDLQPPEPKVFWRSIPSQHLYFFADKILNLNLTYLTKSDSVSDTSAVRRLLSDEIQRVTGSSGKITISIEKPEPPTA